MQGEAILQFDLGHPVFAGHFPGSPIVPGALLLDAAIYHLELAARDQAAGTDTETNRGCQISSAKFTSPVVPGETLTLRYGLSGAASIRFEISGSERKVAEGIVTLQHHP